MTVTLTFIGLNDSKTLVSSKRRLHKSFRARHLVSSLDTVRIISWIAETYASCVCCSRFDLFITSVECICQCRYEEAKKQEVL